MKYGLTRLILSSSAFVDISRNDYDNAKIAVSGLRDALAIEEKFDLIMGNYLDLESDMLSIATRMMVLGGLPNPAEMRRELNFVINRRFSNLLSSGRGYIDQAKHHLGNIERSGVKATDQLTCNFETFTREEYDNCLGYRTMSALRNHLQHFGFPLCIKYNSGWSRGFEKLGFTVTPFIAMRYLEENKDFRRSILEELKPRGSEIDAKPLIRSYVASLGSIHEKVRLMLKAYVDQWERTKNNMKERFGEKCPEETTIGLYAVKRDETGRIVEKIGFVQDISEYRQELERRNGNLGTLPQRYVTSGDIV